LLPPPQGSGPFSRYGYDHWLRLLFIKRLKDEYLPLSEIKNLLDSRSAGELDNLARQVGLIPAGETANATAPKSDPLRAFIAGGSGGARLLREQMETWPAVSDEAVAERAPEPSPASFEAASMAFSPIFVPGPNLNPSEDYDPWGGGSIAPEDEPEAPVEPPPLYKPPQAASKAFPAQSFGAGAIRPSLPVMPPGGANFPAPPPAAQMPPMKMSRFAAPASEVSERFSAGAEPPLPAPAPLLAKMAPVPPGSPEINEPVTGQTWERIEVAPGVELHIEKRIADTHRPALANLLQAARRLFGPKEI
jgi:DNA-binding transcriptional MerR regulator